MAVVVVVVMVAVVMRLLVCDCWLPSLVVVVHKMRVPRLLVAGTSKCRLLDFNRWFLISSEVLLKRQWYVSGVHNRVHFVL